MTPISRVTIQGYRGARGVVLEPGRTCVLVGESSGNEAVPGPLRQAVERIVAAARRAPRTTWGA
jgi:hypothetical protein